MSDLSEELDITDGNWMNAIRERFPDCSVYVLSDKIYPESDRQGEVHIGRGLVEHLPHEWLFFYWWGEAIPKKYVEQLKLSVWWARYRLVVYMDESVIAMDGRTAGYIWERNAAVRSIRQDASMLESLHTEKQMTKQTMESIAAECRKSIARAERVLQLQDRTSVN